MHVAHIEAHLPDDEKLTATLTGHPTHAAAREAAAEFVKANEAIFVDATVWVVNEWPPLDPLLQAFANALVDRTDRYTRDEIMQAASDEADYLENEIIFRALDECEDWIAALITQTRKADR
jgi:hypothetical protein